MHKLDSDFLAFLPEHYAASLQEYRRSSTIPNKSFLNDIAYYLEAFLAKYFEIEPEVAALQKNDNLYVNLHKCQKNFIVRRVIPSLRENGSVELDPRLHGDDIDLPIPEHIFADQVVAWMEDEEKYATELAQAEIYAKYMLRVADPESIIFRDIPSGYEAFSMDSFLRTTIKLRKPSLRGAVGNEAISESSRDIFLYSAQNPEIATSVGLQPNPSRNDKAGCSSAFAIKHTHYCLYCHKRNKDSCSTGLYKKGEIQTNSLGNILSGCPLEQKISEMNEAKAAGFSIAALAIITMDNPMVAVTGHRICNDCKKSCIFQNQEPVDVPQIETKILRDVLSLSKGEEIYELLTKWNPLKAEDYLPQATNNQKILIVGMGPAGFALAYYLLRAGCQVVAIDGSYKFGGVAEYGITSRWDKRFLDLIFKILQNYKHFEFYPGVKFGSNITYAQAKEMGFDKIALCTGAGAPKVLDIPGMTAKGVKLASDFLMSVNRIKDTGPLIPNITLRMPIAIIGGGLSAVDAATEALAYYKVQVMEFARCYESCDVIPEKDVIPAQAGIHKNIKLDSCLRRNDKRCLDDKQSTEEQEITKEFLAHACALQESDDHLSLLKKWGGAKIYYHRDLLKSAAYRINHEELQYVIDEGVEIVDNCEALEILTDESGAANGIKFLDQEHGAEIVCEAKTVLIAIGISEQSLRGAEGEGEISGEWGDVFSSKNSEIALSPSAPRNDIDIYVFGDADPNYEGSVVKAVASAKNGYKRMFAEIPAQLNHYGCHSREGRNPQTPQISDFVPHLLSVNFLASNIVEFIIRAPLAIQNFKPGQFFKLQNKDGEFAALNVAEIDGENLSIIMQIKGSATKALSKLKPGEKIYLLGPLGDAPQFSQQNILVIGEEISNCGLWLIPHKTKHIAILSKQNQQLFMKKFEKHSQNFEFILAEEFEARIAKEDFSQYDHIIAAIAPQNLKILQSYNARVTVAIHSVMQCMMGGVCGSCLQKNGDNYFYSCQNQYQDLSKLDIGHLQNKLNQNRLVEQVTIHPTPLSSSRANAW
jgi:NADPH-dependent glutamate synthase beta subunit-like oxidoreductase